MHSLFLSPILDFSPLVSFLFMTRGPLISKFVFFVFGWTLEFINVQNFLYSGDHAYGTFLGFCFVIRTLVPVLVSLAQLVWTMHKICKVRGSNLGHHKKKKNPCPLTVNTISFQSLSPLTYMHFTLTMRM